MNQTRLRNVAEFFHDRKGRLLRRGDAVTALTRALGVDERSADRLLTELTGDEVDPVVTIRTVRATFVGVLDYHEGDGWYGYTDYHDFHGERRVGVCAQCVHDASTDGAHRATISDGAYRATTTDGPYRTTTTDESWDEVADDLRNHFERAHPEVAPDAVVVETAAVHRTRRPTESDRARPADDGSGPGVDVSSTQFRTGQT